MTGGGGDSTVDGGLSGDVGKDTWKRDFESGGFSVGTTNG